MSYITYIIPYYDAPKMLYAQLLNFRSMDESVHAWLRLLIVDDCSPVPAESIVSKFMRSDMTALISLYRIKTDIPWNRNGARNLGSREANTPWLLHTDIDHVLYPSATNALGDAKLNHSKWYRFKRYRVGRADETRRKDAIPDDVEYGEIKPHGDSYLCTRAAYWAAGGYDEDYSGHLGGGSPFLKHMVDVCGEPIVLPVALHVFTRHSKIGDGSVSTLSRDLEPYRRTNEAKRAQGNPKGMAPLRFDWERLI